MEDEVTTQEQTAAPAEESIITSDENISSENLTPNENAQENQENLSPEDHKAAQIAQAKKEAYVPNLKLKVWGEEKDLDDPLLKSLIKDADTEKKIKDIAEKAMGFEKLKEYKTQVEGDYKQYKEAAQPVIEYYAKADSMLRKKDLDSFFSLVGITDQQIWEHAVKKAEESALPYEQRQQLQQQKDIQRERDYYQSQSQTLMDEQKRTMSEFRRQELEYVVARPEVQNVMSAFDAKNGQGKFKEFVRSQALAHYAATNGKEDLTASQAVEAVMKMISPFVTPTSNPSATPAVAGGQGLIPQNGQPPIIPTINGKGASPIKKQVRSVADIKKRAEELAASQPQQ